MLASCVLPESHRMAQWLDTQGLADFEDEREYHFVHPGGRSVLTQKMLLVIRKETEQMSASARSTMVVGRVKVYGVRRMEFR